MNDEFSSFAENASLLNEIRSGQLAGFEALVNALAFVVRNNVPGGREHLDIAVNLFSEMRKQELVKEEDSEMTLQAFDSVIIRFHDSQGLIDHLRKK